MTTTSSIYVVHMPLRALNAYHLGAAGGKSSRMPGAASSIGGIWPAMPVAIPFDTCFRGTQKIATI
jgi:hypothetical protein